MSIKEDVLNKYCRGKGVFAGTDFDGRHFQSYDQEPGNFYRITSRVTPETADYVLAQGGLFGITKYDPILLKEWFYAAKTGASIIIPAANARDLENLENLVKGFYPKQALELERTQDNEDGVAVVRKLKPALAKGDDINSWTFGIITNGRRNEAMERIIRSIHSQQVPNYEIIVCGTYFDRKEKDFTYIHFTEHDDRGWLTRKKNIVAQAAKYENIIIIHDRMLPDEEWFKGMKHWGNYFDALSCVTLFKAFGKYLRAFDWMAHDPKTIKAPVVHNPFLRAASSKDVPRPEMALHYDDWDPRVAMCGSMAILKKSLWEVVPWDEKLFWVNYEDVNISHRITASGGVIRFNPYSKMETLFWRHALISVAKRDKKKLSLEFERDPLAQTMYNLAYYTKLRWRHFRQDVKRFLKSKNLNKFIELIQFLRKGKSGNEKS